MKIVFLSNFFNHHQKPLSDRIFELTQGDYWFIETGRMTELQKRLGYQDMTAPYVLRYTNENKEEINNLIFDADIVQYGEAPISLIKRRARAGKIIVRDDERRYKAIYKYLKWPIYTYQSLFLNKGYLLGASAFSCWDYMQSGMRSSHCFKWGYFPEVKSYDDIDELMLDKVVDEELKQSSVSILWVGRLIGWKHPESLLFVANKLKNDGYQFNIDVIGVGPLQQKIQQMIEESDLSENIHLLGSMHPEEVRFHMEKSEIFLFTSDRNEGWGAVLNESMNSACAVVASDMIGAVPFLIKDGENGLMFRSENWDDLYGKVKYLIDNPEDRKRMGKAAYRTMVDTWNADVAARNLYVLYSALLEGKDTPIEDGPCSKAKIIK